MNVNSQLHTENEVTSEEVQPLEIKPVFSPTLHISHGAMHDKKAVYSRPNELDFVVKSDQPLPMRLRESLYPALVNLPQKGKQSSP